MRRVPQAAKVNTFSFGFQGGYGLQHRMKAADQHNEIELNYIDRGEMILRHGVREIVVAAGEMIIYWAAIPHQVILAQPRTRIAWLAIPLPWFLSWNLPAALGREILNGGVLRVPKREMSNSQVAPMTRWGRELEKKSRELEKIVELEIEVYFRRLALSYRHPNLACRSRRSTSLLQKNQYGHVQKMVEFMTDHFQHSITVTQIAGATGLNSEYAMRLFRKCWGMTIWEFLLQQRIFHAQRLLVLGDAKILDIAFASGFGSAGRFYHAFRKQCYCTPSAYRRQSIKKEGGASMTRRDQADRLRRRTISGR
jgi:AraC-like DNA-binding protein